MLHSAASGAVVLSDAFGLAVLGALRAGSARELARSMTSGGCTLEEGLSMIAAVTSAWREAGLLAESRPGLEAATSRRMPRREARVLDFRLGDRCVRLRSEVTDVARRASRTFEDYLIAPGGEATRTLDLLADPPGLTLLSDGHPLWHAREEDPARFVLFQEILSHLAGEADVGAVAHGALVVRGSRALMLAGTTGRGKTTLSLALARQGWSYAGDDLFVIARNGRDAVAVPMRAHLKPEASARDVSPREYILPERRVSPGSRHVIDRIVFPHYIAGHAASLREIAPVEALKELLTSGTHVSRRHRSIAPLVRLADQVPACRLTYGTTADAVELCDALPDR